MVVATSSPSWPSFSATSGVRGYRREPTARDRRRGRRDPFPAAAPFDGGLAAAASHPPRHRLEASVEWNGVSLRLMTLHAAVSKNDGRDEQIACLAEVTAEPLLLGSDLNAPPSLVRPLLGNSFADTLSWDEWPTWPVNAEESCRPGRRSWARNRRASRSHAGSTTCSTGVGAPRLRHSRIARTGTKCLRSPSRLGGHPTATRLESLTSSWTRWRAGVRGAGQPEEPTRLGFVSPLPPTGAERVFKFPQRADDLCSAARTGSAQIAGTRA